MQKMKRIFKIKSYLFYCNGSKFGDYQGLLNHQFNNYLQIPIFLDIYFFYFPNNLRQDPGIFCLTYLAIRILNMPYNKAKIAHFFLISNIY